MKVRFYKTREWNGSSHVKIPLRNFALINFENDVLYCFLRTFFAKLQPCNNDHPSRVSNYRQYSDELVFEGFDFTKGLKCFDVHIFEKLNILSINMFELNFYQDKNKWKQTLIPIEINKK